MGTHEYVMEAEEYEIVEKLTCELFGIVEKKAPKGAGWVVLFFEEDTSETIKFACSNPEQVAPAFMHLLTVVMPQIEDDRQ